MLKLRKLAVRLLRENFGQNGNVLSCLYLDNFGKILGAIGVFWLIEKIAKMLAIMERKSR